MVTAERASELGSEIEGGCRGKARLTVVSRSCSGQLGSPECDGLTWLWAMANDEEVMRASSERPPGFDLK